MNENNDSDKNLMADHEYDGIQELDNDLPPWWIMLFITTIIFSIAYLGYYHIFDIGLSQVQAYQNEIEKANSEMVSVGSNGKSLYAISCVSCHGNKGQGISSIKAPQIAGQEKWYLKQQLKNFREDIRGNKPGDISGMTMKSIAKTVIKNEQEIDSLVDYIAKLPPTKLKKTVKGDIAKGKAKYMMCFSCHGAKGEGNALLKAPALKGLNDWYIVAQLMSFKNGLRGKDDRDIAGKMMAPMTLALSSQDMNDLATYIHTLNQ
jgi:cytochrome c553